MVEIGEKSYVVAAVDHRPSEGLTNGYGSP
jgi:hypothetical protein